ncbi:hypothetical protein V1289_007825 [Bradyrhizobium sp. AZCC 2289]
MHPDPYKRYESLSEYVFDLRHPNANFTATSAAPLIERNPLLFWKCTTVALACAVVVLLAMYHGTRCRVRFQASSVVFAAIAFGAAPPPGFILNS